MKGGPPDATETYGDPFEERPETDHPRAARARPGASAAENPGYQDWTCSCYSGPTGGPCQRRAVFWANNHPACRSHLRALVAAELARLEDLERTPAVVVTWAGPL